MENLKQKIDFLEIREEGIRLEYQYVNELKDKRIYLLQEQLERERREKQDLIECNRKMEEQLQLKNKRIAEIENSRWWKLRGILRKEKKHGRKEKRDGSRFRAKIKTQ